MSNLWTIADLFWIFFYLCVVSVMLILWLNGRPAFSSVFCQLISICHYQIVLFFVFAVTCICLLMVHVCMCVYFVFVWGWMFEHVCHCLLLNDYNWSCKDKLVLFSPRCDRVIVTRVIVTRATNLPPQILKKRETLMNKRVGGQIKSTGKPPTSHRILDHTSQDFPWIKHGRVLVWKWEMLIFMDSIVGTIKSFSSLH